MPKQLKIHVAVVGLGFGAEFVPIYLDHPDIAAVTICDKDVSRLQFVGERFNISRRSKDFHELIESPEIDAIHLVTGIPEHAHMTVEVMNSGKHCACTVPAATSLDDLTAVVNAQKHSGMNTMMMETAVYTRQFQHVGELIRKGIFGRIQFLRGAH